MHRTGRGPVSVEIRGVQELVAKLQGLKKTHAKAAIRKGTRRGAKIVASAVKDAAPVVSGALKASIKVRSLPRSKKSVGTDVKLDNSTLFYASYAEFGSKHQKATHFMEEATKSVAQDALETAVQVIAEEIEKRLTQ
jgi:HK97 gp10 family phage protein